jgi:hypothetical protein
MAAVGWAVFLSLLWSCAAPLPPQTALSPLRLRQKLQDQRGAIEGFQSLWKTHLQDYFQQASVIRWPAAGRGRARSLPVQRTNSSSAKSIAVPMHFVRKTLMEAVRKGYVSVEELTAMHKVRPWPGDATFSDHVQASTEPELIELSEGEPCEAALPAALTHSTGCTVCPRFNGRVCNGEKSGKCVGEACECVGGWSGIACQTGTMASSIVCAAKG